MDNSSFDAGRLYEAVQAFMESAERPAPDGTVMRTLVVPVDVEERLNDAFLSLKNRQCPNEGISYDATD